MTQKVCLPKNIEQQASLKMFQKCFREYSLSQTQVFEYHKAFSEGREVIEDFSFFYEST